MAELLFQGMSAPMIPCNLSDIEPQVNCPCTLAPFTLKEITSLVTARKAGKAPWTDLIPNQVIKAGGKPLALALQHLANSCLDTGLFPTQWKPTGQ
ncbi:hypothetical protein CROQUDRAFT_102173 [Cronartium quercuum f. sp. fusiforme G11]|uniref:Uncharacterized protein n=1 Tax=Cronartium quercuum f. sp. fusiforme G11 TaxID=708437 RepID=A0A9P6T5B4_9BASI|nr:hypothetical protein CROQUDRAFT_102173 [Cronartium quercuum f. sp. fusiforme G11]